MHAVQIGLILKYAEFYKDKEKVLIQLVKEITKSQIFFKNVMWEESCEAVFKQPDEWFCPGFAAYENHRRDMQIRRRLVYNPL